MSLRRHIVFAAVFLCVVRHNATAALPYVTIALKGQAAPGSPGDSFTIFSDPSLNDLGQVAFSAGLSSLPTGSPDGGIWMGSAQSLTLVARQGAAAVGVPGSNYGVLDPPSMFNSGKVAINNAGQVAFGGYLANANVTALWMGKPGALNLVARQGSPTQDATVVAFGPLNQILLNEKGDVAFAQYNPSAPNLTIQSIWAGSPTSLHLVANVGSVAPGTNGLSYTLLNPFVLNDQGQVAFQGYLPGSGLDGNYEGIWAGNPASIQLAAKIFDPAPGTTSQRFQSIDVPTTNKSGTIAFRAWVDPTVNGNDEGIWVGTPGNIHAVVRDGDPAPGSGTVFDHFNSPVTNSAGRVAFSATLRASQNTWGIWAGQPGELKLLAKTGEPATGLGADFDFSRLDVGLQRMNERGQVAFFARFSPANDPTDQLLGIWAADTDGNVIPILYDGQKFNVSPNDQRIVRLDYERDFDLNDAGQISFTAQFSDGSSGVFLTTVPEPQWSLLIIPALVALPRRKKQRGRA